ncbi:hypothetical protein KUCAC02_024853, partial [Chaenocephalus aceratus]
LLVPKTSPTPFPRHGRETLMDCSVWMTASVRARPLLEGCAGGAVETPGLDAGGAVETPGLDAGGAVETPGLDAGGAVETPGLKAGGAVETPEVPWRRRRCRGDAGGAVETPGLEAGGAVETPGLEAGGSSKICAQSLKEPRLEKKLKRLDEKRGDWVSGRKKNHNIASIVLVCTRLL